MRAALPVVALLLATTGCADATAGPESVADRFEAAVSAQDGQGACALLAAATVDEVEQSSGEPCPKALLEDAQDGGARVESSRFGTMAQVRYRDDVLFLTRGPD